MLFKSETLTAIWKGRIDLAFRRWTRPRVKVGTRLRTHLGLLEIRAVDDVKLSAISARDARRAGYESRGALLAALAARSGRGRRVFRVRIRTAGDDLRIALREKKSLTKQDLDVISSRLARSDAASARPWTTRVLRLIQARPEVRAADLAASLGVETQTFKTRVRRLKELGLTESLAVGYRLSPRGAAYLRRLHG